MTWNNNERSIDKVVKFERNEIVKGNHEEIAAKEK